MTAERMETPEEVAQTLARYEALAIETGEWEGTDMPMFSADGVAWLDFWLDAEPPALARATVKRRGIEPVTVTLAWREAVPEQRQVAPGEIDWHARWMQNPMAVFGAAALRRAYQRAFRDVIGDARVVTKLEVQHYRNGHATAPRGDEWAPSQTPRDFLAEVRAAEDGATVDRIWESAKGVRTPQLERACRERKRELLMAAGVPVPGKPTVTRPAPAIVPRPPAPDVPHLEKPVTRKGESRARRDSGRRGGGRRG